VRQAKRDMRKPSRRPWRKKTSLWRGWSVLRLENLRISSTDVIRQVIELQAQVNKEYQERCVKAYERAVIWGESEITVDVTGNV